MVKYPKVKQKINEHDESQKPDSVFGDLGMAAPTATTITSMPNPPGFGSKCRKPGRENGCRCQQLEFEDRLFRRFDGKLVLKSPGTRICDGSVMIPHAGWKNENLLARLELLVDRSKRAVFQPSIISNCRNLAYCTARRRQTSRRCAKMSPQSARFLLESASWTRS